MASAYRLLTSEYWNPPDPKWKLAWKWPGPQRIRTFLWLTLHGKLLTNTVRAQRHMTSITICEICHKDQETIDHILRHCQLASSCWSYIVPPRLQHSFYTCSFQDWLESNLTNQSGDLKWQVLFGSLCWRLWDARNRKLFNQESTQAHRLVNDVLGWTEHIMRAKHLYKALIPL